MTTFHIVFRIPPKGKRERSKTPWQRFDREEHPTFAKAVRVCNHLNNQSEKYEHAVLRASHDLVWPGHDQSESPPLLERQWKL